MNKYEMRVSEIVGQMIIKRQLSPKGKARVRRNRVSRERIGTTTDI